jgi:hypothetical protein
MSEAKRAALFGSVALIGGANWGSQLTVLEMSRFGLLKRVPAAHVTE